MARYVVRKGRLRKDEPYDPGTLVYYDEGLFQAGRAWLKNLSLGLTLAYLSIVAIAILRLLPPVGGPAQIGSAHAARQQQGGGG